MKKTKISKSASKLPADFSTDENVIVRKEETKQLPTLEENQKVEETPAIESPAITEETKQTSATDETKKVEDNPLPIPEIDQDASLKIDEAEMMTEELPETEKKGKLLFMIGSLIGLIVVAGSVFLGYLYFKAPEQKTIIAQPTPTPTITEVAKAELVKTVFNFEILNASGISGQAGKTQIIVEGAGYKVASVGNANSRETGTKLLLDASLTNQKDLLIADLQKILPGIAYEGEFASDTANARIIIGE